MFNIWLSGLEVQDPWFIVLPNFHGVSTFIMVNFELSVWYHWMSSLKEVHTVGPVLRVQARSSSQMDTTEPLFQRESVIQPQALCTPHITDRLSPSFPKAASVPFFISVSYLSTYLLLQATWLRITLTPSLSSWLGIFIVPFLPALANEGSQINKR